VCRAVRNIAMAPHRKRLVREWRQKRHTGDATPGLRYHDTVAVSSSVLVTANV